MKKKKIGKTLVEVFKEEDEKNIKNSKEELFDADPNCKHEIITRWSGVKCVKCNGWYCF